MCWNFTHGTVVGVYAFARGSIHLALRVPAVRAFRAVVFTACFRLVALWASVARAIHRFVNAAAWTVVIDRRVAHLPSSSKPNPPISSDAACATLAPFFLELLFVLLFLAEPSFLFVVPFVLLFLAESSFFLVVPFVYPPPTGKKPSLRKTVFKVPQWAQKKGAVQPRALVHTMTAHTSQTI